MRQRFTLLRAAASRSTPLRDRLAERFDRREQSEAERIERVVALVEHDGCQVQALVGYFGEARTEPCGHCTFCLTGQAQVLPEPHDAAGDSRSTGRRSTHSPPSIRGARAPRASEPGSCAA